MSSADEKTLSVETLIPGPLSELHLIHSLLESKRLSAEPRKFITMALTSMYNFWRAMIWFLGRHFGKTYFFVVVLHHLANICLP